MKPAITDQIRLACAEVARRATLVRIVESAIEPYAHSLPLETIATPTVDPEAHYMGDDAGRVAYFLTLDSINFGSGCFPHLIKRPGRSGYYTVAMGLKDEFDRNGPMAAGRLATITPGRCAEIFGQDRRNGTAMGLMSLFSSALNDLGRLVLSKYGGDLCHLAEAAGKSALRLMELLAEMPFYRDVHHYGDLEVPLYKRAQIASADLAIALGGKGLGEFVDLDRLTMFADNLVPHVLRIDGLLEYDPELAGRIDREEPLTAGSPEELEIRAGAVHAVERMREILENAGKKVNSMGLDSLLWHRGQGRHYKTIKPRHRARCVYY